MTITSEFFSNGMFKKPAPCPEKYSKGKGNSFTCGPSSSGIGKWDPLESLSACVKMAGGIRTISKDKPVIVETKFDGNHGIFEMRNGESCIFSEKKCNDKLLPKLASDLLREYLEKTGNSSAILDGEMFLEKCIEKGKEIVPTIGIQTKAIKGDHPEMLDNCTFTYKLFDIIDLNGNDVSGKTASERKALLRKILPGNIYKNVNNKSLLGKNISIDPIFPKKWKNGKPAPVSIMATSEDDVIKFICDVTERGEEGVVIKDKDSIYKWRNQPEENREGWWKLKEMLDVDVDVVKACLGNLEKTAQHSLRYKILTLGVCDGSAGCNNVVPVGDASSTISEGELSGLPKYDAKIHYRIVDMIKKKEAIQSGTEWVHVDDAMKMPKPSYSNIEYEKMTGGIIDPTTNTAGLPKCVELPVHSLILSVVTTEINPPSGKGKYPTLQGPVKLHFIRDDKKVPNDLEYLDKLMGL